MSEASLAPPKQYPFSFDASANKACNLANMRLNWRAWASASMKHAIGSSLYTFGTLCISIWYAAHFGEGDGFLVAAGLGFVFGLISPFQRALRRLNRPKAGSGLTWCTLTEEGWSQRTPAGVSVFIPWGIMKLRLEVPEAWMIQYDQKELVVYRQPLRLAGLEAEFLERLRARKNSA